MAITEADIQARLRTLTDPVTGKDFVSGKAVKKVRVDGGDIVVDIQLGYPAKTQHEALRKLIVDALAALPGAGRVTVNMSQKVTSHSVQRGVKLVPGVKNIIAIASGKGGVGKSTTAVNLALALAAEGAQVGVLDADIYGPSQPMMLGIAGRPESRDGKTLEPLEAYGLQAMSIGFLIDVDTPMVWRGPMVTQALEQLLKDTNWRDLDYLIVDMPPGTGDIQLTLAQKVPVTGAVIVTTPQDIALIDARKGLKMFEKVGVPIVGVVENMSMHICSNCGHAEPIFGEGGGEKMCADYNVPFLGGAAARHPHPRANGRRPSDGRRRSGRQDRADLSRDCPQDGGVRRAEGRGFLRQISEHRGPEHVGPRVIKSDKWIRRMAKAAGMIEPFEPGQVREANGHKIVSYGTSSYGYDIRCSREFKIFTNINSTIVDPKAFDAGSFVDFTGDVCIIPPNSFALARTIEFFRIPRNVLVVCLGKSTYARCGIIVNVTPLEPEWEGHVTLEFSNTTPAAGEDLRERRRRPGDLLRIRRGLRNVVQGPRRQVPGPAGRHAAQDLGTRLVRTPRCPRRRNGAGDVQSRIDCDHCALPGRGDGAVVLGVGRHSRAGRRIPPVGFCAGGADERRPGRIRHRLSRERHPRARRPRRSAPSLCGVRLLWGRWRTRCCSRSIRRRSRRRRCASSPASAWRASTRSA